MLNLNEINRYKEPLLNDLERLVNADSFSYDKEDVDTVGREFQTLLERAGCDVDIHESTDFGNSLLGTVQGSGSVKILMLGHMDTVHRRGVIDRFPYRVDGNLAHGPGTVDMKAAVLMGCYTLQMLKDQGFDRFGTLSLLINSDEEIGSPSSRAFIEEQALNHDVVLVLEGPQTRREIVSRRKGSAKYQLTVHGQAAHAGVEPELGRNALHEMAYQIIGLQALNSPDLSTTVNVCMAESGEAANAIPARATATIDVRALNAAEVERIDAAIREQVSNTTVPDVSCTLEGGWLRPPMEKTPESEELIKLTQGFAEQCGFSLEEITMGGGTDGNFTAAVGVPTLDGLGPDGGLSHSEREYLEISSIWERMSVLAMLIDHLSSNGLPAVADDSSLKSSDLGE